VCEHHGGSSRGHDVVERAVECMVDVAVSINEMKRRHEKIVRVMELQTRLQPRHVARDLTTLGQLVLEVDSPQATSVSRLQ